VAVILIPLQILMLAPAPVVAAALAPPTPQATNGPALAPALLQPPPEAFMMQPKPVTLHPPVVPVFAPPSSELHFSADPTDAEIITSRCFIDMLIPQAGDPKPGENADLAKALLAFHAVPRDVSPLTTFLDQHPDSRWKASLLANLGPIYFHQGYWSKALAAFAQAWELSKGSTDLRMKMIADRDLGDLATMYSRLGDTDHLEALLTETAHRELRGPGAARIADAKSGLWMMKHVVGKAFRCGPIAVKRIYQALFPGKPNPKVIGDLKSSADGVDLFALQVLAGQVGMNFQTAFRSPGAPVLAPAVVHWKTGHFSALIRKTGDKYLVQESVFGLELAISSDVLDVEASGYALVPAGSLPAGWRSVDPTEAKTVLGKGAVNPDPNPPPPCDSVTVKGNPCKPCQGMATYDLEESSVGLMLMDTPVGYTPPFGPPVQFTANYNQRDSNWNSNESNVGFLWSFNLLSYLWWYGNTLYIYGPGGGLTAFTGLNSNTGFFTAQLLNQEQLQQASTTNYILFHKDGSRDVYDLSFNGNIYRTKTIAASGNAITYNYDNYGRLRTIVDALGQTTVIDYVVNPYNADVPYYTIAKVTDPFGRYATFTYNDMGQLASITDVLGIISSFTYGNPYSNNADFVTSLTTPYGTTTFSGDDVQPGSYATDRWLMATDPMGAKERIEWVFDCSAVAGRDPQAIVPTGFTNAYLNFRNTFYWDKHAMAMAPNDYSKARITHWLHQDDTNASTVIESTKEPFENRVWRAYAGQSVSFYVSTSNKPTRVARILDDGTEQDYQYQYNASGNMTQSIDPLGRETDYVYDTNNVDLLQILQKDGTGYDVLGSFTYNAQHEPLTGSDASGQTTTYTYNSAGQVRTVTNAKGQTTTFWYSPTPTWTGQPTLDPNAVGYLVQVDGPVAGASTRFNYDGFGRVQSAIDSEGYTVTTSYDVFDRPTAITYPDGTSTQILYNRLDPEWICDRLGRWTRQMHDALRHVVLVQDSLGRKTGYDWCSCGSLSAIIDPAGNATTWFRDVQSRVIKKAYPDGTMLSYNYEQTTSRLKSMTDAMGQVPNYAYNLDNSIQQVSYTDASGNQLASTAPVVYTYDPIFPRLLTMTDGVGTTAYTYNQLTNSATLGTGTLTPTTGAGRIGSWVDTLTNSTISYTYDELGRVLSSSINGTANTSSVVYDTLGRIQSATNLLGTFGYQYVNQTGRVQQIAYPNGQVTNFSYYPNSAGAPGNDDQRLQQIQNLAPGGANLSTFGYGYNAVGMIATWSKQIGAASALTSSFYYDAADQLIGASVPNGASTSNYSYGYDIAGNRTREQIDPGVTGSTHNNLNQLTAQNPGGPMQFTGTVNKWATVTVGGQTVTTDANGNWSATTGVTTGANAIPLVATDVNGNKTTKTINITVTGGASRALTYDLDGNMVNDGAGKIYSYDAANRLLTITQGSNVTTFVYNGLGQRVQETLNGSVIKQWIWNGGAQPAEERDGSNNVTKRFYAQGEQIGGANYFFTTDHLGSIREMTDSTGTIHARYDYDPYGRITKLSGDLEADFGFTGFYRHQASGLDLTLYRVYDPNLGRWPSRDPIGENGGLNLYGYVENGPINRTDPFGLLDANQAISIQFQLAYGIHSPESDTARIIAAASPMGPVVEVEKASIVAVAVAPAAAGEVNFGCAYNQIYDAAYSRLVQFLANNPWAIGALASLQQNLARNPPFSRGTPLGEILRDTKRLVDSITDRIHRNEEKHSHCCPTK